MFLVKIFKYLEPAWTGNDGKFSVRSALAIVFSINLIRNLNYAIRKWEAGQSYEGLALLLSIEAGLIAGLLVLKTYQNSIIGGSSSLPTAPPEEKKVEEVVD